MEITNYNNKEYLEKLIENEAQFKEEIISSKGFVLTKLNHFNILFPKEMLLDNNFTFFGVPFLMEMLKKEGLNEKDVNSVLKKQISLIDKRDNNKESPFNKYKDEFLKIVISDYKSWKDRKEKLKILGIEKEFNDWLLLNESETFDINDNDFLVKIINYSNLLYESREYISDYQKSLLKEYLNKTLKEISVADDNKRNEMIMKLSFDLKNINSNSSLSEPISKFIGDLITKVGFENLSYELIKKVNWSKQLSKEKMTDERSAYLRKFLLEGVDTEDLLSIYSFDLEFLYAINLDWSIPEDKEIFIKVLSNIRTSEEDFYKSSIAKKNKINIDELVEILPSFLNYFVLLDPKDRWTKKVENKILATLGHRDKIEMMDLVRFFGKSNLYRDNEYIKLDKDFINNLLDRLESENKHYEFYGVNNYLSNVNKKHAVELFTIFLERKLKKDLSKVSVEEEVLLLDKMFNCLIGEERNDEYIITNNKSDVLNLENLAYQYMTRLSSMFTMDDKIKLATELKNRSTEFNSLFLASLIKDIKSVDSLYLATLQMKDRDRRSYSSIKTKDLLDAKTTVTDLLPGTNDVLKEVAEYEQVIKNITTHVEREDYDYSYRESLIKTDKYFGLFLEVAINKLLSRDNYKELTDTEFGSHLNSLNVVIEKFVEKGHKLDSDFKKLKKQYKSKSTKKNMLSVDTIVENFNENYLKKISKLTNLDSILKDVTKQNLPSVELMYTMLNSIASSEANRFNVEYKKESLEIIKKDINKYKSLKPILLKIEDTKNITSKMVDDVTVESNIKIDPLKIFIESQDVSVFGNSNLLKELNKDDLLDVKNFEKICKQNNVEKLNVIIDNMKSKLLNDRLSNLDFDTQYNLFTNPNVKLSFNKSYSSDKDITFNCQTLDELKKAVDFLRPIHRSSVIQYIDESYDKFKLNWEACSIFSNIKINSTNEIIDYLIDEFPLSFFESYLFSYKGRDHLISRVLTVEENTKLLNNIEKKVQSIFGISSNVNADLDLFKVNLSHRHNDDESLLNAENFLQNLMANLNENKEKPLYYLLFLISNSREMDNLHNVILNYKHKDDSANNEMRREYEFVDIPKNYLALNEFQEIFKQKSGWLEKLNKNKSFSRHDDEILHNFMVNYIDLNILMKGVEIYRKEYLYKDNLNHRLEERIDIGLKYLFSYNEKKGDGYSREEKITKIDFTKEQQLFIVKELMKNSTNVLFYPHSFIFSKFKNDNSSLFKDLDYKEASPKFFKCFEDHLINNFDYPSLIEDFLLNSKGFAKEEEKLNKYEDERCQNTLRFLDKYLKNSKFVDNNLKENIMLIIDHYEKYSFLEESLIDKFKESDSLRSQYYNILNKMDMQKNYNDNALHEDFKNIRNKLEKDLMFSKIVLNEPTKRKKIKY